jgi:NADH-ubiquinone oxidoreductase chain 4
MLKFLVLILFLIPLILRNKSWHVIHAGIYLSTFIFILMCVTPYVFNSVRIYFGCDVLSYGLILLSF